VLRCRLDGIGAPPSVIVKWLRDDPNGFRIDARQIATERAALEFLDGIAFRASPRLIAADAAMGVVIMEDLAPREPLAERLRRDGAAAHAAGLLAFAQVTGDLAAATVGRSADYDAVRASYGDPDPLAGRAMGLGAGWDNTRRAMEACGLAMSGDVAGELASGVETLVASGPFLVLTNGDPQANNVMVGDGGARLIDFETAAFRHALISATWIHVPGPHWITVAPEAMRGGLEDACRRAMSPVIPHAEDDRLFGFGMAAACATLAYERLNRFPRLDARPAGDPSRVQIVATLEAAAAVTARHAALPQLGDWLERVAATLRLRWPDADVDLAAYSPFTPRL
jgi:hypothetical protein